MLSKACKLGVITSQMFRFNRRCFKARDFIKETALYCRKLIKEGYTRFEVLSRVLSYRHWDPRRGRWSVVLRELRKRILKTLRINGFKKWYADGELPNIKIWSTAHQHVWVGPPYLWPFGWSWENCVMKIQTKVQGTCSLLKLLIGLEFFVGSNIVSADAATSLVLLVFTGVPSYFFEGHDTCWLQGWSKEELN